MASSEHRLQDQSAAAKPLDVRLSVEPAGECNCPPAARDPAEVNQSLTRDGNGNWTCATVLKNEDGCDYEQVDACESCPCYQFSIHDCVAQLLDIRNGKLHYSVTIPDRSMLAPLIDALREKGADVSVQRILAASEGENETPALTDKQRETLRLAIELGYYDRPREASLDDIADELNITTSAASQRLTSVKRRLIQKYAHELEAGTAD